MASASISAWEKAAPSSYFGARQFSSSHKFLVPFELLPPYWSSEQVILSKCVHGPFERNTWDSTSPPSPSPTLLAGFYSQKLWGLLFLAPELWAGSLVWGWGEPFDPQRGISAAEIPLPIFIHHTWVWDQRICISTPPTSLSVASYLKPWL